MFQLFVSVSDLSWVARSFQSIVAESTKVSHSHRFKAKTGEMSFLAILCALQEININQINDSTRLHSTSNP